MVARRSDPEGLGVSYEVESPDPTHAEFEIIEAGEPPQSIYFPLEPGNDIRFHRGHRFKPTIEGTNMTLSVRIYQGSTIDANRRLVGGTLVASATCPGITVLP